MAGQKMGNPMALAGKIFAVVGAALTVCGLLTVVYTMLSLSGLVSAQGTILSCIYSKEPASPR